MSKRVLAPAERYVCSNRKPQDPKTQHNPDRAGAQDSGQNPVKILCLCAIPVVPLWHTTPRF